jgi:hypothetical protein
MLTLALTLATAAGGQDIALDAFSYQTDTEAQAHWIPQAGSAAVRFASCLKGAQ